MYNKKEADRNSIELRAHHLLCSVLFEGKGYSDTFTENMTKIVNEIKNKDNYVILRTTRDVICSDCPNLKDNGGCSLDDKIPDLDKKVLEFFDIPSGVMVSTKDIFINIDKKITPDFFELCCGECRWKKMGICSYEKYKNNLKLFMDEYST